MKRRTHHSVQGARARRAERPVIGWREWVGLPELGIHHIKAKVDTGARTSSLHAWDLEEFQLAGTPMVRFCVHPVQRDNGLEVRVEVPISDRRRVRPSTGKAELRPVITTAVELLGMRWEVELTLTRRDAMGFRMLLGRQAIRRRLLVDPGRSFLCGKPAR